MTKTFKILVVDDDALASFIQKKALTALGYEVVLSNNAVSIISLTETLQPDLIIMDHNMPLVSGLEATKLLKAHSPTAAIPLIYFSSALDIEQLARQAGADAFVSKADSKDHMAQVIALLLAGR